ncbi:helix-turn-helix domain-containing protein [Ligilactobacillus ruminis]|uniref:helix-turn-helix domain-containing protein n=1 Tax=Ligilactobacillus ruminis TaxID=1623 RepID=UPI0034A1A4CC
MIGQRIRDLRKQKRMSQTELAKSAGVSQTTVTAWETGKAEPSSSAVAKLADIFNVTTDYLLGKPEMKKETDIDLDNALDNAVAYNGKPISDDDRAMAKSLLQAYFGNKK